jgi:hypothetical protein
MNRFICGLLSVSIWLPASVFAQTFTTGFDGTENPLSEGGAWSHQGLDWKLVRKADGVAFGTQTGTGGYDDSYAILSGFPADQSGAGVIQRTPGSSGIHEVEILLRWTDSAHSAKGYECLLSYDASYAQIVRWNGPFGDFTYIGWAAHAPMPKTGDTFSAAITGNLIIAYYNGAEIMRATDTTYHAGNPGIGFYRESAGSAGDMGFSSYTAAGLGSSNAANPENLPKEFDLSLNFPNPFNSVTAIHYQIPHRSHIKLQIVNLSGQIIRHLQDEEQMPGYHTASWDGCDDSNRSMPSGNYFCKMNADHFEKVIKLSLLK